jgi:hypothetical protein
MKALMQTMRRSLFFGWPARAAGGLIALAGLLPPPPTALASTLKVALLVENRAGANLDAKVTAFEDFFASRAASQNFQVMSRQLVLNALRDYAAGGSSAQDTPGRELDRALSDRTSALRLAQALEADYVVLATLTSYGSETLKYQGQGIETANQIHSLRVTYRLAEAARGGEVGGDSLTAVRTIRQSAGLQVETTDLINQLLDNAAAQLAARLTIRAPTLAAVDRAAARVRVNLQCTVVDFARLPNVGLNERNEIVLAPGNTATFASDVNVEVNGITIGSAPGIIEVMPGLNKLRLSREGFKPYERTVNFYEGQTLTVALQMSEEGFARWKEVVAAYTALENNRKLTDAEVEVLRGYARMLRQSGYRVDTKDNIRIYRSLY